MRSGGYRSNVFGHMTMLCDGRSGCLRVIVMLDEYSWNGTSESRRVERDDGTGEKEGYTWKDGRSVSRAWR
jgi:hypothetical protein